MGTLHFSEASPVVDEPLWDEVQAKLADNAVERRRGEKTANPSLLAGLLYDGQGHRMTPSHAVKKGHAVSLLRLAVADRQKP